MASVAEFYTIASQWRRTAGEGKSAFKRRQRQYIIDCLEVATGVRYSHAAIAKAIRDGAPDRQLARLQSTIHEYRPDRSRLRKRGRLVERAVIDADQSSADSWLRTQVSVGVAKLARSRVLAGKAIHKDAIALGKVMTKLSANPHADRNTPNREKALILSGFADKVRLANQHQRRAARLRAPDSDADKVTILVYAVADHGWRCYNAYLRAWRGESLTKRQRELIARAEFTLGNAVGEDAIADAEAAKVKRDADRQRQRQINADQRESAKELRKVKRDAGKNPHQTRKAQLNREQREVGKAIRDRNADLEARRAASKARIAELKASIGEE